MPEGRLAPPLGLIGRSGADGGLDQGRRITVSEAACLQLRSVHRRLRIETAAPARPNKSARHPITSVYKNRSIAIFGEAGVAVIVSRFDPAGAASSEHVADLI